MKFFRFLEINYVLKNIELQKEFDLKLQAETKACHDLIEFQRRWFKRIAYIKLTCAFLWASLTKEFPKLPESPIKEEKTEQKENNVLPIQTPEIPGAPISVV